jgi:protein TonB
MLRISMAAVFLFVANTAFAGDAPTPVPANIKPPSAANEHTIKNGYPELSRALYEEGVVTLKFTVGIDGKPVNLHVLHSSGYPRLDAAAMDEVGANWLYHPATRDGQAIPVMLEANVRYSLRDDPMEGQRAVFRMTPEQFPPGAWDKHENGMSAFVVSVKSDGTVYDIDTTHASGYDDLDDAARKAIQNWTFTPAAVNGNRVATGVTVLFVWPANPETKTP